MILTRRWGTPLPRGIMVLAAVQGEDLPFPTRKQLPLEDRLRIRRIRNIERGSVFGDLAARRCIRNTSIAE